MRRRFVTQVEEREKIFVLLGNCRDLPTWRV